MVVRSHWSKVTASVAHGLCGLAVEVLRGPGRLVEFSQNLRFHIARDVAHAFFDIAAETEHPTFQFAHRSKSVCAAAGHNTLRGSGPNRK